MNKQEKQEVDTMLATAQYLTRESELALSMQSYLNARREEPTASQEAKQEALDALRRMGVVDEDGKRKEKIVSWE